MLIVHIWLNMSFQTFFYAMPHLYEKEKRSALQNVTPMLFLWRTKISFTVSMKPELVLMNIKKVFWSIENLQAVLQWVLQFGRVLMTSTHRALGQLLCLFSVFGFYVIQSWNAGRLCLDFYFKPLYSQSCYYSHLYKSVSKMEAQNRWQAECHGICYHMRVCQQQEWQFILGF